MSRAELAIITLTKGTRMDLLEKAVDSVRANLPPKAQHYVITCPEPSMLAQTRWRCFTFADYVAFVDDDDMVMNDGIRKCLEALKFAGPSCGISFTNEEICHHVANRELVNPPRRKRVMYKAFMDTPPAGAHHLAMYRTDRVPRMLHQHLDLTGNSDWLCSSATALMTGAIHIPEVGYQWRIHKGCLHQSKEDKDNLKARAPRLRELLHSVNTQDLKSLVPVYVP